MDSIAESAPAVASTVYCGRWTDMWNRLVPAAEVVAADCQVYFGRKPQTARPTATTGPHELQSVIDAIRERLPGIRYRVDSPPLYQAESNTSGIITLLWNVAVPGEGTRTGIDLLRHEGARITPVSAALAGRFGSPTGQGPSSRLRSNMSPKRTFPSALQESGRWCSRQLIRL